MTRTRFGTMVADDNYPEVPLRVEARSVEAGPPSRPDGQAAGLYAALSELVRVYQFRDRDRICCHDISVTQCYALEALLRIGPSSLGRLAGELYLDKSTASRVVATLERKGYVRRAADPGDGRAVVLTVTGAGRRLHDRIRADLVRETARLVADFEPDVREAATRIILRLARAAAVRSGLGPGTACGGALAEGA